MKTLDQILSGVTAQGKWYANGIELILGEEADLVATFDGCCDEKRDSANAAFAALAARKFELLVRALQDIEIDAAFGDPARLKMIERTAAKALAEALEE